MDQATIGPQGKKQESLTRRILALIGIVIFFGLPIYSVDEGSE